jgi:hypothetical protein
MSNNSIITRLEAKLNDFILKNISNYDFSKFLVNSIEALDNINYDTIKIANDFAYKFEVADFAEEDIRIEDIDKVTIDFRNWLKTLEQ